MIEYSHLLRVELNKKEINILNEEIEELEATTTTDIKSKRELKKQITLLKQQITIWRYYILTEFIWDKKYEV